MTRSAGFPSPATLGTSFDRLRRSAHGEPVEPRILRGPGGGETRTVPLCASLAVFALVAIHSAAQTPPSGVTRLAILQAEDRRAPTARDVAVIRSGSRSADPQTTSIAVRS